MTAIDAGSLPRPWMAALNLILPGAGLIALGEIASGLLIGVAFTACANYALLATLIVPDVYSRPLQLLGIGFTIGTYFGAQLRYTLRARRSARSTLARQRRAILTAVQEHMAAQDWNAALVALKPLAEQAPDDLFVNYRVAQILTAAGTGRAADTAWRRLQRLDRRGLYREIVRERLGTLENRTSRSE
jgi:hypothetical protein